MSNSEILFFINNISREVESSVAMAKVGASSHVIAFLIIQIIVIALFFVFVRFHKL